MLYFWVVAILGFGGTIADPSVHVLSENFNQVVTSTTLQWVPVSENAKIDFQDAVVGAEQIMDGEYLN